MISQEFENVVKRGVERVLDQVYNDLPLVSEYVQDWMISLSGTHEPADYFLHPAAFPLMLLPWWVERQLTGSYDPDFQTDLVFSNANLYYYIRLVDNIMDGHASVEPELLPTAGFFSYHFFRIYHDLFEVPHPFWEYIQTVWADFCDVTIADGLQTDIDEKTFHTLIGRKVGAAKISVAAVCHRYNRPDIISEWDEWIDLFGRWHLFQEDLFDWKQDMDLGSATFFRSTAQRMKQPDETEINWIAREGMVWGFDQLDSWMQEIKKTSLVTQDVRSYLEFREQLLQEKRVKIEPALATIRKLSKSYEN